MALRASVSVNICGGPMGRVLFNVPRYVWVTSSWSCQRRMTNTSLQCDLGSSASRSSCLSMMLMITTPGPARIRPTI
jgi:hypothetical protein